ncbi:recombinase family protein [Leifsonia xyli]|uniref:recombinase family protein n=1 Tax=Leifsonia xyli TaxID=1575 RepID=UPI0038B2BBD3
MLAVQEVDRLGRNLLEGLVVLNDLFQRGVAVKVLDGIAAGEHTERSLILDIALALSEDRRRDIATKAKNGLDAPDVPGASEDVPPSSTTTNAPPSTHDEHEASPSAPSPCHLHRRSPQDPHRNNVAEPGPELSATRRSIATQPARPDSFWTWQRPRTSIP